MSSSDDEFVPGEEADADEQEDDGEKMPWSTFNKTYAYVKETDTHNFVARCRLCNEERKCSNTSTTNLRSHLKRKHNWTEAQLKELNVSDAKRRKETPKQASAASSAGSNSSFFEPRKTKAVTQKCVDDLVDKLVINETLPHRILDSPYFKAVALCGLSPPLKVSCRQTFRKRLDKNYDVMKNNLKGALRAAKYVSTTADGWSRFRRGFLGMTVTWLHPDTLVRSHAALALRRLKGRHTHDRLASAMSAVHQEYDLAVPKITKTTTDSAANFRKAFKVFAAAPATQETQDLEASSSDEELEDDPDDVDVPIDLTAALDAEVDLSLPPHQRCGAHIINLIGTTDAKVALDLNAAFRRIHESTTDKLKEWWRRQNRSDLVAEAIVQGLGVKFQVPGDTRWNSEFDARAQIVKLLDESEEKLTSTLDSAGLPKLTTNEAKYLREFVWVMAPVAQALDILQRDKEMYAGFLIPTVLSMEKQLGARQNLNGKPLKYCEPLLRTLKTALREPRRFGTYLIDRDLEIAAALLPAFRLDWVTDPDRQFEIKSAILNEMSEAIEGETPGSPSRETETERDVDEPAEVTFSPPLSPDESFFGFDPVEEPSQEATAAETPTQELNRYLNTVTRRHTVQYCYGVGPSGKREFPRLATLFLKYNTSLPASATVERFFSTGRYVFSDTRNGLADTTLDKECCLKTNKDFW